MKMEVGIDLVKLDHIKNQDLLAEKILSNNEKELFLKKENKLDFLASRFAAKEAFIKAMDSSIFKEKLNEIEVLNYDSGKPYIKYKEKIYKVSISHEKDYAIAIVIID